MNIFADTTLSFFISFPLTFNIPSRSAVQHLLEDTVDFSQMKALVLFQNTAHPDAH